MGAVLNSLDSLISAARSKGLWKRATFQNLPAGTAANITSGYTSARRCVEALTLPSSFGSGVTGALFTLVDLAVCNITAGAGVIAALEYTLGTLTISGNVFASGVSMPSKSIHGSSIQTASLVPMLVVTSALTATTPTITITYTDQDGNTGQTATLTLPTSPALNTAFFISPHLAAGDTGIRAVTNISTSAGTAGELKVMGLLPIGFQTNSVANGVSLGNVDPLTLPFPIFPGEVSEKIALYVFGATTATDVLAMFAAVADN